MFPNSKSQLDINLHIVIRDRFCNVVSLFLFFSLQSKLKDIVSPRKFGGRVKDSETIRISHEITGKVLTLIFLL